VPEEMVQCRITKEKRRGRTRRADNNQNGRKRSGLESRGVSYMMSARTGGNMLGKKHESQKMLSNDLLFQKLRNRG